MAEKLTGKYRLAADALARKAKYQRAVEESVGMGRNERLVYLLQVRVQLGYTTPERQPDPRDCAVCGEALTQERRKSYPTAVTCDQGCSIEHQYQAQLRSNRAGQRRRRRLRKQQREKVT